MIGRWRAHYRPSLRGALEQNTRGRSTVHAVRVNKTGLNWDQRLVRNSSVEGRVKRKRFKDVLKASLNKWNTHTEFWEPLSNDCRKWRRCIWGGIENINALGTLHWWWKERTTPKIPTHPPHHPACIPWIDFRVSRVFIEKKNCRCWSFFASVCLSYALDVKWNVEILTFCSNAAVLRCALWATSEPLTPKWKRAILDVKGMPNKKKENIQLHQLIWEPKGLSLLYIPG